MLYISLKARLLHHSLFPPKYSWGKKKTPKQQDNPQQTDTVMKKQLFQYKY